MGIGSTLSYGFGLIKKYPKVMLPAVANSLIGATISLLTLATTANATTVQLSNLLWLIVLAIVAFFVGIAIEGIYISIAEQGYGKNVSLSKALEIMKEKYMSLFGTSLLVGLIIGAFAIVLALITTFAIIGVVGASVASASAAGTLPAVGAVVLVVLIVAVILSVLFFEAAPVVILENKTTIAALKRGWEIGTKNFWSILMVIIPAVLVVGAFYLLFDFGVASIAGKIAGLVVFYIVSIFTIAWYSTIPVAFYHEYVLKRK